MHTRRLLVLSAHLSSSVRVVSTCAELQQSAPPQKSAPASEPAVQ